MHCHWSPGGISKDGTLCMAHDAIESVRKPQLILSFQCTQHIGSIIPWVLAWATWHHSAHLPSNSSFSFDIQPNKNSMTEKEKGGMGFLAKRRWCGGVGGRDGREGEKEKACPGQRATESSLWYSLISPPTSCEPCIPCVSSIFQDKPTFPSLSHAALMSARGHEVND